MASASLECSIDFLNTGGGVSYGVSRCLDGFVVASLSRSYGACLPKHGPQQARGRDVLEARHDPAGVGPTGNPRCACALACAPRSPPRLGLLAVLERIPGAHSFVNASEPAAIICLGQAVGEPAFSRAGGADTRPGCSACPGPALRKMGGSGRRQNRAHQCFFYPNGRKIGRS